MERPDRCGRVRLHSPTRELRDFMAASESLQRHGVIDEKEGTEVEG